MVSSISFKMRQLLIMLTMLTCISSSIDVMNTEHSHLVLKECLEKSCTNIISNKCNRKENMENTECIFDISKFSQNDVNNLLVNLRVMKTWLLCDNSVLSDINLSKVSIGIWVNKPAKFPREDSLETFEIVNNVNLKYIVLPDMSKLQPGFFTITNNPRLSRLSIDNIRKKLVSLTEKPGLISGNSETDDSVKRLINSRTVLQKHGECDYSSSGNTPLSWPQFRWCRTIPHDVILEGDGIKSGFDPAYILNVNGRLTIKNTNITDLSILPVYFKSKGGEITGNKDLCINFEDEIRMKRLDFKMENNKPLSCRTTCDGGTLTETLQTIRNRKDCITLNGGLVLDGIDADTAAADFFKTIRVINGPVSITNAKVTVDFKELKEIRLAGENSPHISLTNCAHPILFPNLTTLNGTGASPMVLLNDSRIDIYNYLNRTYPGKIKILSRILETTTITVNTVTLVMPSSTENTSKEIASHVSRSTAQPSKAHAGQTDAPGLIEIKPTEKPMGTITEASPTGKTDDGAVKNSNLPSQGDSNNSAVEGKSNVLMVMTIVSLVVFIASSATSVGIIFKYSVM